MIPVFTGIFLTMINLLLLITIAILVVLIIKSSVTNAKLAKVNALEGDKFLIKNATEQGVNSLPSGLQYSITHTAGNHIKPASNSKVTVHYHGRLIDGTVFDSSIERDNPISFGLSQVIKGWQEGILLLNEGDKATLYVPYQLAYGKRKVGKIPPASLLIFDVELIKVH